jgi:hypothetical protein
MKRKFAKLILVTILSFLIVGLSSAPVFAAALSTPQISGQTSYNSVTVQYSSSSKVSGYEVTIATQENGTYKTVYTGPKTNTTISRLSVGTPVFIKVRAYTASGSKKTYSAAASIRLEPSLSSASLKGTGLKGTNTLTWTKVSGAGCYEISFSASYSGEYKILASVNTLTYKHKVGLKTSTYYKVRAYTLVNGVKGFGPYSNVIFLQA